MIGDLIACAIAISRPDFETHRIEQYIAHLDVPDQQYVLKLASEFALVVGHIMTEREVIEQLAEAIADAPAPDMPPRPGLFASLLDREIRDAVLAAIRRLHQSN